jgi:hypothetical protein
MAYKVAFIIALVSATSALLGQALPLTSTWEPHEMLEKASPIRFLHIPKAGTSFHSELKSLAKSQGINLEPGLGHEGFSAARDSGHVFTMLRDPKQRLMSAYWNSYWKRTVPVGPPVDDDVPIRRRMAPSDGDVPLGWEPHGWSPTHAGFHLHQDHPSLLEYAKFSKGLVSKQLSRHFGGCFMRLHEDEGASVGITNHWQESICLLQKKYGGPCSSHAMVDFHPGAHHDDSGYDISELSDFTDPFDEEVYSEALNIFHERLERFNVTKSSCNCDGTAPATYADLASRTLSPGPSEP